MDKITGLSNLRRVYLKSDGLYEIQREFGFELQLHCRCFTKMNLRNSSASEDKSHAGFALNLYCPLWDLCRPHFCKIPWHEARECIRTRVTVLPKSSALLKETFRRCVFTCECFVSAPSRSIVTIDVRSMVPCCWSPKVLVWFWLISFGCIHHLVPLIWTIIHNCCYISFHRAIYIYICRK